MCNSERAFLQIFSKKSVCSSSVNLEVYTVYQPTSTDKRKHLFSSLSSRFFCSCTHIFMLTRPSSCCAVFCLSWYSLVMTAFNYFAKTESFVNPLSMMIPRYLIISDFHGLPTNKIFASNLLSFAVRVFSVDNHFQNVCTS